jgi:hypothetical protein
MEQNFGMGMRRHIVQANHPEAYAKNIEEIFGAIRQGAKALTPPRKI